jgi:hypothetical protein
MKTCAICLPSVIALALCGPLALASAATQTAAPAPAAVSVSPASATLAPGVRYDPRIPTVRQVLGFDVGERITSPDDITTYLKALQAAAPERTRLIEYARTWEGRPLHVLVVGAPERIARIEEIKKGLRRLADPRGLAPAEAEQLVKTLPVVVWLMHAVHGNEISSCDAALAEAYHLLAAQGDASVDAIRSEALVVIDPLENPDGRARFHFQNLQGEAAIPDSEPASAEHDEPWPGGRSNHYLFDMNRDWFAQSQPETRGRTRLYLEWFPQVVADLHEMGGNSSYYFAPPADPINPLITKTQVSWLTAFGRANAARFDERGFSYFIREEYDSFYPGYGESWPIFQGAVGMTYEQASARGLRFRRQDETMLSYFDGILHHFTSAMATADTAAKNREQLLRDFLEYRRSAVQEGETGPVKEYVILPGVDPSRATRLARLLAFQGFDVKRAEEAFKLGTKTLPAGSFLVPVAQPASRLLRNLMEPQIAQPESFVKEQDRRRRKRLNDQIYDITAWSLPLAFDVDVVTNDRLSVVKTTPVPSDELPWLLKNGTPRETPARETSSGAGAASAVRETSSNGGGGDGGASAMTASASGARAALAAAASPLAAAKVGYLVPWGSQSAAFVIEALREGIRVRTADLPFTLKGRTFSGGTAIIRASDNGSDLAAKLGVLAAKHGVEVVATDTAFVESGVSLGSNEVVPLKAPRVLLAWDAPSQSLSAGWARFVLERRFGQPVTVVRVSSLPRVDLTRFDVFILPSGTYTSIAGEPLRQLKDWIARGGTLITIAEASRWATRENVGLLSTVTELRSGKPDVEPTATAAAGGGAGAKPPEGQGPAPAPAQPIQLDKAIEPERERPSVTSGALCRVTLDLEHWLTAGTDGQVQAMVEGQRVFTPLRLDKGRNIGTYAATDVVASGLVWDDVKTQLANKAFVMDQPLGGGHVIAFAEDPNFRAFMEGTELLFINAVLFGPAH